MSKVIIKAEPGEIAIDPARTAIVMIDMQRDFLEPGGFGETLGTTSPCWPRRSRQPRRCWRRRERRRC